MYIYKHYEVTILQALIKTFQERVIQDQSNKEDL